MPHNRSLKLTVQLFTLFRLQVLRNAAGLLTHEFVHGLAWNLVGPLPWRHIRFGFQLKTFSAFAMSPPH